MAQAIHCIKFFLYEITFARLISSPTNTDEMAHIATVNVAWTLALYLTLDVEQFAVLFELDLIRSGLALRLHHVDVRYVNAGVNNDRHVVTQHRRCVNFNIRLALPIDVVPTEC